jgi:hypothetical protein
MSSKTDPAAPAGAGGWLPLLLVLAVAIAARAPGLGEWSLWEDEETSLFFSQRPERPFPASFPIFFRALGGVFDVTGVGILPGRVFCATLGVLSVALTYLCLGRIWGRRVGVVAALFVGLSLGHLFWSQSIRYYILLFLFQLLSLYWFLDGFERGRWWELVLANVAMALGVWTHFSGALLMPVFVGYLVLMLLRRESGGGYNLRGYLAFGVPFLVVAALFAWQFLRFRASMGSLIEARANLARVVLQVVIYFGPGTVLLGLLAPVVARGAWRDRRLVFLLVAAVVPVLELVIIRLLNLAAIGWHYAFFALIGFAGLAAISLVSLAERGYRLAAGGLGGAALVSLIPLLVFYHLFAFGNRPRWREATAALREEAKLRPEGVGNPPVFSNVPGVVAHYLGIPPGETMGHQLVRGLPVRPPEDGHPTEHWYLVEVSAIPPDYTAWLERHCELKQEVVARSGPKDRTLKVYHYQPAPPHASDGE